MNVKGNFSRTFLQYFFLSYRTELVRYMELPLEASGQPVYFCVALKMNT